MEFHRYGGVPRAYTELDAQVHTQVFGQCPHDWKVAEDDDPEMMLMGTTYICTTCGKSEYCTRQRPVSFPAYATCAGAAYLIEQHIEKQDWQINQDSPRIPGHDVHGKYSVMIRPGITTRGLDVLGDGPSRMEALCKAAIKWASNLKESDNHE